MKNATKVKILIIFMLMVSIFISNFYFKNYYKYSKNEITNIKTTKELTNLLSKDKLQLQKYYPKNDIDVLSVLSVNHFIYKHAIKKNIKISFYMSDLSSILSSSFSNSLEDVSFETIVKWAKQDSSIEDIKHFKTDTPEKFMYSLNSMLLKENDLDEKNYLLIIKNLAFYFDNDAVHYIVNKEGDQKISEDIFERKVPLFKKISAQEYIKNMDNIRNYYTQDDFLYYKFYTINTRKNNTIMDKTTFLTYNNKLKENTKETLDKINNNLINQEPLNYLLCNPSDIVYKKYKIEDNRISLTFINNGYDFNNIYISVIFYDGKSYYIQKIILNSIYLINKNVEFTLNSKINNYDLNNNKNKKYTFYGVLVNDCNNTYIFDENKKNIYDKKNILEKIELTQFYIQF